MRQPNGPVAAAARMMTLDALARMAERMPSEPASDSGSPPYRFPDALTRVRRVQLPPIPEERRRATALFAFVAGSAALTLTLAGLLVTGASAAAGGEALEAWSLLTAGAWYGASALGLVGPLAAFGIARELDRYRRARTALGAEAWLDSRGYLHSNDGSVRISAAARD